MSVLESDPPPDEADLQRMDALRRDLRAAAERAISAGAKPGDIVLCMGLVLGGLTHNTTQPPPAAALAAALVEPIRMGREEEAERRVTQGLQQIATYGGEARRRSPRR